MTAAQQRPADSARTYAGSDAGGGDAPRIKPPEKAVRISNIFGDSARNAYSNAKTKKIGKTGLPSIEKPNRTYA